MLLGGVITTNCRDSSWIEPIYYWVTRDTRRRARQSGTGSIFRDRLATYSETRWKTQKEVNCSGCCHIFALLLEEVFPFWSRLSLPNATPSSDWKMCVHTHFEASDFNCFSSVGIIAIAIVIVASVVGHQSFPVHVHGCPWTADRRRMVGEDLQLRTGQTVWHRMENQGE